jgi:hypothetical protein
MMIGFVTGGWLVSRFERKELELHFFMQSMFVDACEKIYFFAMDLALSRAVIFPSFE